ncbi:MAG: polysaccharide biosynthesis tyrosine autokinase, partial [Mariniblastus sp.]|nr:polysaccharide biosynthesis tyrosine autokinase [Mariniblastus sp.]
NIPLEVAENVRVSQNEEEETIYDLSYRCSRPDDAQTILNNLIATYELNLESEYELEQEQVSVLLKTVHEEFNTTYKNLQKEYRQLCAQKGAAITTDIGGMNVYEVQVRNLGRILESSKTKLHSLSADKKRAKAAINGGVEQIETFVWNLKQTGKISDDGKDLIANRTTADLSNTEMKIRELYIEREAMSKKFGPGHRNMETLNNQINTWEEYRDTQIATNDEDLTIEGLEPQQVVIRFVQSLDEQIGDLQDTIRISGELYQTNFAEAQRIGVIKVDIQAVEKQMQQVSDFVQIAEQRLIEIETSEKGSGQEGFNYQILQDATYGDVVWPILPMILGIGGLLGSLTGFGLGCLVELADKTFHNPDEIMKQLHVPLIGHIPVIGQSKRYLVENSLIEPIVCTYHRPKSQVSEAFRAVRTSLYFNTQGKNHSVVQVTSPTPGDGKSTLASNLAVSIAQSGKRVLLVDADMRRPRQHSTFGMSSKEGFATVLSGRSQWRDVMYECEEIEGLTLMPCGAKPYNPAELCSSPQVKILIEEMREEFDFVIIDTPPLLAVTDPCPIAARVDGVILCLRIKKNVRISAERATEMLASLGAKCIGLVVNGVGAQSGYGSQYTYGAYRAGYSYNGYGYGYGYGNGKYYEEDQQGRQANLTRHLETQPEQPPVS